MTETRFELLLGRLLDEELTADELAELVQLARDDPTRLELAREQFEAADLIAQAVDDLRQSPRFVAATLARAGDDPFVAGVQSAIRQGRVPPALSPRLARRWPWAAAAAVLILAAATAFLLGRPDPSSAKLTALNGSLRWTGAGGQVEPDLEVGHSLSGGTLESLSADSWAVLEFHDGSSVTVSGQSVLTIGGRRQKEMHLRRGSLSASVVPQPAGRPMVIHTPTARLEVLGTQFNVEADPSSTVLTVNEGRVRITRLIDGNTTDVPADHQVVASVNRLDQLKATLRPAPVSSWQSDLPRDVKYGHWLPWKENVGTLRAASLLLPDARPKPLLIYLAAIGVTAGDSRPVLLSPEGRVRVCGWMGAKGKVYVGLTTHHPRGGFAGKYVASRSVEVSRQGGEPFDIELGLDEFKPLEGKFPALPNRLELVDCWCLTPHDDLGLSVDRVELRGARP